MVMAHQDKERRRTETGSFFSEGFRKADKDSGIGTSNSEAAVKNGIEPKTRTTMEARSVHSDYFYFIT